LPIAICHALANIGRIGANNETVTTPPSHLSELMALLAHDLRNPLSALLTNINFIKSSVRGHAPDVEEAIDDSALSCTMLGQVIGNLDVISRAFSTAPLARQAISARNAASDAAVRFAPQAAMTGIRIEVPAGDQSPVLLVEPGFFGRALDNLVANALQYSPADAEVRIECAVVGPRGSLVIVDGGPTIPSELRELARSAEWQGQAKQRYEARYGRGLGLYCAGEAARIAGAEMIIGNREGRSTFELSAPLATTAGR
jgi:signal transduction histidine kinase